MAKIVEASPVPLGNWEGSASPTIEPGKCIVFNGKGDEDSHETFAFPPEGPFTFCKTASKPYDIVVVACLAVAKDCLSSMIDISSDGDRGKWEEGVALASKILNREIANPIGE